MTSDIDVEAVAKAVEPPTIIPPTHDVDAYYKALMTRGEYVNDETLDNAASPPTIVLATHDQTNNSAFNWYTILKGSKQAFEHGIAGIDCPLAERVIETVKCLRLTPNALTADDDLLRSTFMRLSEAMYLASKGRLTEAQVSTVETLVSAACLMLRSSPLIEPALPRKRKSSPRNVAPVSKRRITFVFSDEE